MRHCKVLELGKVQTRNFNVTYQTCRKHCSYPASFLSTVLAHPASKATPSASSHLLEILRVNPGINPSELTSAEKLPLRLEFALAPLVQRARRHSNSLTDGRIRRASQRHVRPTLGAERSQHGHSARSLAVAVILDLVLTRPQLELL